MSTSSSSSMRTRTIGRSPEIPCGPEAGGPAPRSRASTIAGGRSADRSRGSGWRDRWKRWASSGVDAEVVELHLRLRPGERGRPARTSRGRDTCRPGRAPSSRDAATSVEKIDARLAPGARRTRRRRLKMGSSTAPVVFDSGRRRCTDIGVRIAAARGRGTARGRSRTGALRRLAFHDDTCAAQTAAPRRDRGRRVASSAPSSATHSVWTNRFENAGWAASAAVAEPARPRHTTSARTRGSAPPRLRERDAPDLGVVLGRDQHLERGRDAIRRGG